jgi:hypothetical protein
MGNAQCVPHFLGIGAARCGSTWLHRNLSLHHQIWMPHKKELHYFDRSPAYPSPSHLGVEDRWDRLFGVQPQHREHRRTVIKTLLSTSGKLRWSRWAWDLKYCFGRYDDPWYLSLFDQAGERLAGEITPAYSILEKADVEHVAQLLPHVRIIYLMRNPIECAWSGIRRRAGGSASVEELRAIADLPAITVRVDFLRTLSIWRSVIPQQRMFIGFYDQIVEDPERLLLDVFRFLDVQSDRKHITESARQRFNAAPPASMPRDVEIHLASKWLPQIQELSTTMGGYAKRWLQDAQRRLGSTATPSDQRITRVA